MDYLTGLRSSLVHWNGILEYRSFHTEMYWIGLTAMGHGSTTSGGGVRRFMWLELPQTSRDLFRGSFRYRDRRGDLYGAFPAATQER